MGRIVQYLDLAVTAPPKSKSSIILVEGIPSELQLDVLSTGSLLYVFVRFLEKVILFTTNYSCSSSLTETPISKVF